MLRYGTAFHRTDLPHSAYLGVPRKSQRSVSCTVSDGNKLKIVDSYVPVKYFLSGILLLFDMFFGRLVYRTYCCTASHVINIAPHRVWNCFPFYFDKYIASGQIFQKKVLSAVLDEKKAISCRVTTSYCTNVLCFGKSDIRPRTLDVKQDTITYL